MRERTVEVAGHGDPIRLAVAEAGEGGRPLLLVHGFTGAKEDFTEWLDPLAEAGWHAVAPDQRGHGSSDHPASEEAYSLEILATDLLGLLDALGWTSAVVLGHSMGGMVVQTAVLRAPERFGGLVLMDTSHRAIAADPAMIELGVAIARQEGMASVLAAQDAVDADNPLANEAYDRLVAQRPDHKAFGDRKLLASSPAMYAAMLSELTDRSSGVDRLEGLAGLAVPTLVIVGELDGPFRKPSERMAAAIEGAELVVVPGAGHSPQFEGTDLWWKSLSGFLEQVASA